MDESVGMDRGPRRRRKRRGPDRPPLRPDDDHRNPDTRAEATDAPSWLILLLGGLAVGLIALVVVALILVFPQATHDPRKTLSTPMPEPRLQTDPAGDLRRYRASMERTLHSYGWVDRQHGLARIPIEEAMRRVAERGIPDWPEDAR